MKNRFEITQHPNGTSTLRDLVNGQQMHSRVGPWVEAKTLYAEGSQLAKKLAARGNLVLHDVGMGTASNVIASLEAIETFPENFNPGTFLNIESFETEVSGLEYTLEHLDTFPFLIPYRDELTNLLKKRIIEFPLPKSRVMISWRLFEGDYFQALAHAKKPEIIFYDFYSVKAEPNLWSEETFMLLRAYLGSDPCELYTYSAATPVRLALLLAGFYVGYGARTEMKTETTVAANTPSLVTSPLAKSWLDKLRVSSSITDEELRERGIRFLENYF